MIQEAALYLGKPAGALILCIVCGLTAAFAARVSAAMGKADRLDSLLAAFLIIEFSAAFILLSFGFEDAAEAESDPRLVPLLWGGSLFVCSALQFIKIWNQKDYQPVKYGRLGKVALTVAVVFTAIALFDRLGFFICTGAMITALMLLMGERRVPLMAGTVCVWIAATWLVFNKLLLLGLPVGSLFK